MPITMIPFREGDANLEWSGLCAAFEAGHRLPRAEECPGLRVADDLVADFYQPERFRRESADEITLFKNGGGAHLDLMTGRYILDAGNATG